MCFNPWSILSGIFCGLWGNRGKKMSNYNYFSAFLLAVIFALVIEYLPSPNIVTVS